MPGIDFREASQSRLDGRNLDVARIGAPVLTYLVAGRTIKADWEKADGIRDILGHSECPVSLF
jgi:hypothetical protein